jgi:hypothetical protein
LTLDPRLVDEVAEEERARAQAMVAAQPLSGRIFVTGYEGSELAYARLLVEAGAEVPYVSTSIGQDPLVLPDEMWLRARGTQEVVYRKSLEDDVAALDKYPPDLVFGTTPFCSVAKERGIPAMYFTNQLASRPFFLSVGMAATLGFIRQTMERGERYQWMQDPFLRGRRMRRLLMPKVIRDLSDTSSYWAAVWTMCAMPDVHVICDAPIGCFNLVATAVPDYTDAIPHIENITPSVIREQEVGGSGTATAVQRTYENLRNEGLLEGKHLIVVSTAESEMIGSDLSDLVTRFQPGSTFFHSESLSDDEWTGRDRVLRGCGRITAVRKPPTCAVQPGLVNIIGPTYGCFNSAADLHEIRRLIEGAGGHVNLVFPIEARLADIAQLAKAQVNVVMYKEFGHTLAEFSPGTALAARPYGNAAARQSSSRKSAGCWEPKNRRQLSSNMKNKPPSRRFGTCGKGRKATGSVRQTWALSLVALT